MCFLFCSIKLKVWQRKSVLISAWQTLIFEARRHTYISNRYVCYIEELSELAYAFTSEIEWYTATDEVL